MSKPRVFSAFKPSGKLHIGNYLGALKQAVERQDSGKYECFYAIADLHALTERYSPKDKVREIFDMAVDAMAVGIDPKKSIFFIQSHVSEHANLGWIFNTITPMGRLEGMIEYKEKVSERQSPNVGLFDYPVLMAADILLYKASLVPVGADQRQHLELARDVARTFNARFGKTFPEPKALFAKAPRIMSLNNPSKKMSKSIPGGCIYLTDSPKAIREKVKTAVTDSHSEVGYDPEKRPAVSNLVLIYSEFSGESPSEVVKKFKGVRYVEFKSELAELIIRSLKPIQQKRIKLLKNKKATMTVLEKGTEKARRIARVNYSEIKKRVGLI